MNKLIIAFAAVLFFVSCQDENLTDNTEESFIEIDLDEKSAQLIEADNQFGFELFQQIYASETESENIMVSPLSISLALAMTYNGADGETKTSMEETLKLHGLTKEDINTSYKTLIGALKSLDNKVILQIANAIFYRDEFFVEQEFLNNNRTYYDAEVSALDFWSPAALNTINAWVADKTNNKIETILDEITPDQVMFLVNAIYFKGIWQTKFEEENTVEENFHLENGSTSQTSFMQQSSSVLYTSNNLGSGIQLPYGQGNYNMNIFLPNSEKSLQDLIDALNKDTWENWMQHFVETEVQIKIPKYKYEYEIKLNEVLSDLGMEIAFSPSRANFAKMNPDEKLYIDYVKHKSFIEVNEEGTEAAAATIVAIAKETASQPISFVANKPFLFAITEKSTGAILFIGTVKNPQLN